tara:strand:- start:19228 stop:19464 length:237 start_codon:yes stop_codon:yes gene_type:complete
MFSFDRENITIVMTVLALAAVFYMYQDSQKMKKEISECKSVSVGLVNRLASVQAPAREASPVLKTAATPPPTEEENAD